MSRFSDTVEEVLDEIGSQEVPDVESLAERIARQLVAEQRAARSDVEIRARFPLTRRAPVSGKPTPEIYTLIGIAAATPGNSVRLVGVEAEGMMACPCAQDMVATAARQALIDEGMPPAMVERALQVIPAATHNQRGRGTLIVGADQPIRAEDLVGIVEASMSAETYDLLKRPDELFVVGKAHRHPRFVEDAVREMLYSVTENYPDLPDWSFLYSKQINFETIHKHEVYAERAATLAELRREIAGEVAGVPTTTLSRWLDTRLGR
jgi:GTP cyclohydrolase-4